jgi:hypothetical protein
MAEKKLVSFRLPEPLIAELKAKAAAQGISMTELVYEFSRQGLNLTTADRLGAIEEKLATLEAPKEVTAASLGRSDGLPTTAAEGFSANSPEDWGRQLTRLRHQFDQVVKIIPELASEITRLEMQLRLGSQ